MMQRVPRYGFFRESAAAAESAGKATGHNHCGAYAEA